MAEAAIVIQMMAVLIIKWDFVPIIFSISANGQRTCKAFCATQLCRLTTWCQRCILFLLLKCYVGPSHIEHTGYCNNSFQIYFWNGSCKHSLIVFILISIHSDTSGMPHQFPFLSLTFPFLYQYTPEYQNSTNYAAVWLEMLIKDGMASLRDVLCVHN